MWWIIKYFVCHDKRRKSLKILQNANISQLQVTQERKKGDKIFLRLLFVWTKWLSSKYYPWPDDLFMKNCTHASYSVSCLDMNLRDAKNVLKHVTNCKNALLRFIVFLLIHHLAFFVAQRMNENRYEIKFCNWIFNYWMFSLS